LESLALYEKLFSQCRIILSTWEDEREAIEKFFKDFDKTLVMYSKKPIEYGYSNINLQITSTRNALQAIEPNEYKVIVKTRSDQRITNRATMQKIYFDLLNQSQSKASRIYIPSMNTFLYRIFGASDMLQIARFETLRVFWNLEHDSRDSSNLRNKVNLAKNSSEYSALQLCEVFLTFKYAKSIDPRSEFNYVEWLKFLRDKTFVLDERELGLVWPKYSFDFARHGTGNIHSPMYQVSTFDWIRMQNSLETYQSLERNLYIPFEQEIR
jgi:hypothetical protein